MVPTKRYISADEFQVDIWKLSAKIISSNWKPDIIIALWRGGATVGITVHEFFKAKGWSVNHLPLKCGSYSKIGVNEGEVSFSCAQEIFDKLSSTDKVLIVDDVFDTGKTAQAIKDRMNAIGCDMKIACVYWKREKNTTNIEPDFYTADVSGEWIVFPHEIDGLTPEEINEKNPLLAQLL